MSDKYIDALERDRLTLYTIARIICETHTNASSLYSIAYNALPDERRIRFSEPATTDDEAIDQSVVRVVNIDEIGHAHFGEVVE